MSHEGRMLRGKLNFEANKLLDNEDTKYFLQNSKQVKEEPEEEPKKKKSKKESKKE